MEERFTYDRLNRQTAIPVVGLSHRSSRVAPMAAAAMRQPCGGPLGVFAVVEQRDGYRPEVRYAFKDHLGSWTTVADAYGQVLAEQSFDAWGNLRDPDTWLNYSAAAAVAPLFGRGFTGHEHLAGFGLINMKFTVSEGRAKLDLGYAERWELGEANGRMYDPVMSSFLSVDNYVQNPDFSQNFNRYAYCYNNPLKYTDPDGEWIQIMIGAVIGGVTNLACNWGRIDTFGEGLAYFGIGAAAGALGAATCGAAAGAIGAATTLSSSVASGAVSGAVGGFVGGFTIGAGNAMIQGCNIGEAFSAGMTAGGKGALIGGVVGVVAGGIQYGRTIRTINKGCKNVGIKEMSQVNDGNLRSLQKQWFPDVPMDDYVVNFSIDNVPTEELEKMIANNAGGKTVQEAIDGIMTGKSSVYFNRNMIPTLKDMFFTMGHEFVHVGQISTLAGLPTTVLTPEFILKMEVGAYSYSAHLGQSFAANPISHNEMAYLSTLPPSEINELSWLNFRWLWNFNAP